MTDDTDPMDEIFEPLADRDDLQEPAGDTERSDARGYADRDPLPGVKLEFITPAVG